MNTQTSAVGKTAPSHVPPELIRDFTFGTAPGTRTDPHKAMTVLHRDMPDIFFNLNSETWRASTWVVTRYDLLREIMADAVTFSSHQISQFSSLIGETWNLIPLELDTADHAKFRQLLNPLFLPQRMNALEESIHRTCVDLIDKVRNKGECEFAESFGRPFPVSVFLMLMGLPLEESEKFLKWEHDLLHTLDIPPKRAAALKIKEYLVALIDERRRHPVNDFVSHVVISKVDDRLLTDEEALAICYLLFVGGLDTVASSLGFAFKYLATHPEEQERLRNKPELIEPAIEELLRAHSVVTTKRIVTRDIVFHGVPMCKGDWIDCATMLANLDPREFLEPLTVDFARSPNRHFTFGTGPHRCIGAPLARREFRVAISEWIKAFQPFRLKAGTVPKTHAITVFGVDELWISWDS
jgi:cytochrome P450